MAKLPSLATRGVQGGRRGAGGAPALPRALVDLPLAVPVGGRGRAAAGAAVQRGANIQAVSASRAGRFLEPYKDAAVIFAQVEQRIESRDSAVSRAKAYTEFDQKAVDKLRGMQTEADLSDNSVIHGYRKFLQETQTKLLASHQFPGDSKAALEQRLEGMRGQYMSQATGLALDAKRQAADDQIGAQTNKIVESVYGNSTPVNLLTQFEEARGIIEEFSASLTPNEERDLSQAIESDLIEAAVTSFLDRGDIRGAEEIMTLTGVGGIIEPQKRAQIFSRIGTARAAIANRRSASQRPFVIGDRLVSAAGEVLYDAGPGGGESPFGTGVTAGTLDVFNELSPRFAAGETTPDEDRVFISAVTNYTQEKVDPNTGLYVQPKVPEFVSAALEQRGYGRLLEQTTDITGSAYQAVGQKTVWELAGEGLITGPVPIVGRLIGRVPGLGGPAPEMTTAKSYVTVLKRDLVRTLQNNPKFADAERKAIEKEIDIGPQLFDDPEAYKQRVIGIADALEVRIDSMTRIAASKTTGREQRKWARNGITAIENFLGALLPPRVQTEADALEFIENNPPGTVVLVKQENRWIEMEVPAK